MNLIERAAQVDQFTRSNYWFSLSNPPFYLDLTIASHFVNTDFWAESLIAFSDLLFERYGVDTLGKTTEPKSVNEFITQFATILSISALKQSKALAEPVLVNCLSRCFDIPKRFVFVNHLEILLNDPSLMEKINFHEKQELAKALIENLFAKPEHCIKVLLRSESSDVVFRILNAMRPMIGNADYETLSQLTLSLYENSNKL